MEMYNQLHEQAMRSYPGDVSRVFNVPAPPVHQGIGNALRAAYLPRACEMPKDIAALLAKLG